MPTSIARGGKRLNGRIKVQGAKNAVLPILAASIINGGKNVIHNCPKLRDVEKTIEVLRALGCRVIPLGNTMVVDSGPMDGFVIEESLMRQMRSSILQQPSDRMLPMRTCRYTADIQMRKDVLLQQTHI